MWCEASCCTALGRVIAGLGVLRSGAYIVAARAVANLAAGCISVGTAPRNLRRRWVELILVWVVPVTSRVAGSAVGGAVGSVKGQPEGRIRNRHRDMHLCC